MTHSLNALKKYWQQEHAMAPEDFLVLALFVLQKERGDLFKEKDTLLSEEQKHQLENLLKRRHLHEPVAYLTGTKEFYGRSFHVTSATLIPRPDSECLIEDILTYLSPHHTPYTIFDIGTGSGALAITLAKELQEAPLSFFASDISIEALTVAETNAQQLHAPVQFLHGAFLAPYQEIVPHLEKNTPLYIVANLPYVSQKLFQETAPDVHRYEPKSALLSDEHGLAHYHKLLEEIQSLPPGISGVAWFEISPEQTKMLTGMILERIPNALPFVGQDLSKRDRFVRFSF